MQIRIESSIPETSSRVSGIAFVPHPDPDRKGVKVSEAVAEDVAARFCSIGGYSRASLSDAHAAAVDAAIEKLIAAEALGDRAGTVSAAERTVGELQDANRAVMEERDALRNRVAELERAGTPEAAKRLSADVERLTKENERLTSESAAKDQKIAALEADVAAKAQKIAELEKAAADATKATADTGDGKGGKDGSEKGGKNK